MTELEIPNYKIVELLGKGGMGIVFRATDERLHRNVALKVLSNDLSVKEVDRQRFQREAIAASALDHPNNRRNQERSFDFLQEPPC